MRFKFFLILILSTFLSQGIKSQDIAVKTNLLYDLTTTFNLGAEFSLTPQLTLDVSGNLNPWTFSDNMKWKHWAIQPEFRYWFCQRMSGHFMGIHAHGGQYNMGNIDTGLKLFGTDYSNLKDNRYEGWFVGAGIAYGYAWILNKHWNLEIEIGLGYSYTDYDKYECATCGRKLKEGRHHYFGPTKAAISLVYIIK